MALLPSQPHTTRNILTAPLRTLHMGFSRNSLGCADCCKYSYSAIPKGFSLIRIIFGVAGVECPLGEYDAISCSMVRQSVMRIHWGQKRMRLRTSYELEWALGTIVEVFSTSKQGGKGMHAALVQAPLVDMPLLCAGCNPGDYVCETTCSLSLLICGTFFFLHRGRETALIEIFCENFETSLCYRQLGAWCL